MIPIDPEAKDFEAGLNMVYDDDRMRRMRIERLVTATRSRRWRRPGRYGPSPGSWCVHSDEESIKLCSAQVLVGHKREETFVLGADLTHRIVFDGASRGSPSRSSDSSTPRSVSASGFLL